MMNLSDACIFHKSYLLLTMWPVDPELLKGASVALQLVGRKWSDAQLLADVECIEAALQSA